MKTKWIVENFEADNKFDLLVEEIKRQGHEVCLVRYIPFEGGSYNDFEDNDCVIVQSSINLARQLQKEKKWVPGPWINTPKFECVTYYAYLGKYLVNKDYIMLPRSEIKRQSAHLIDTVGDGDAIFIRPSSGQKTFTGKVFFKDTIEKDWKMVEEFTDPESIVILSSPKVITKEWRFVASYGEIVTGSLYRHRIGPIGSGKYREVTVDPEDVKAQELALEIAGEHYDPDPMYVIDICKTKDNQFHLLEIGSFSCAGLYDCNIEKIVTHATSVAIKEWKDITEK